MEPGKCTLENLVTSMPDPSFWAGKRVLITGHTGFKGSWLLLWLQQLGACVFTYALEPDQDSNLFCSLSKARPPGDEWHHQIGNLQHLTLLKSVVSRAQPEFVFHLAAQSLVLQGYKDPLGTWATNVTGSLHLLEALRMLQHPCAVVMVTTDKVYENTNSKHGCRETDALGGHDPYSASKAGAEIAISSWLRSFCGTAAHQTPFLRIATARAGNVIGGGDWASDRIVPDAIRSLIRGEPISLRNPTASRPWQHVLESLSGYLTLAERMATDSSLSGEAFNFGPASTNNRTVIELVSSVLEHWPGRWTIQRNHSAPFESEFLSLQIDKAEHSLGWQPRWDFSTTLERTIGWYRAVNEGASPLDCCLADLHLYSQCIS